MHKEIAISAAEAITMFCRLNINTRKNIPIRSSHMGLLIWSVKSEDCKTPVAAASFFNVTKPMITTMIKSLEANGYIIKKPASLDKRSYEIKPTNIGVKLVNETYNEYYKIVTALHQQMGNEDFQDLVFLLEKANEILRKENTL